jgi:DNA-binding IclR family transcriptional regulator
LIYFQPDDVFDILEVEEMAPKEAETIKVLDRSLILLDRLIMEKRPLGVNELSKLCGLNISTVFRIMKTLVAAGWAYQLGDDKYIIGQKFFIQTEKDNFYLALQDVAYPIMCRLSAQEHQAMNLCVRLNEKVIILQQSRTGRLVDFVPPKGSVLPVYATGCGKVLFCELKQPVRDDLLEMIDFKKFANKTIVTRQLFLQELLKVKTLGYGIDFHESLDNTSCVAVAIRNPKGHIIAALSFSGFIGVQDENYLSGFVSILRKAADEVSEKLFNVFDRP